MHYWLTVVWIFILWTSKGLTESRPQDSIEYRSIDTGSWKPLPLTSGRIIPPAQPSIDQHSSRVRVENRNEPSSNRQARSSEEHHETTIPPRQNKAANPEIRDSIKLVTNQLLDPNNITLDTRTPPKLQKLHQHKHQAERIKGDMMAVENSHPGIAIPVTEEDLSKVIEEHTKKVVIHRNHNKVTPTTDSGLSTWILLSGGQTTTSKTVSKPETTTKQNKTVAAEKNRPNNKIRTTTRKPTPSTSTTTTEISEITEVNILQNNKTKNANKVKVPHIPKEKSTTTTTTQKPTPTTTIKTIKPPKRNNTNITERIDFSSTNSTTTKSQQNSQTVETKEGELDLTTESNKKASKKPPRQSTSTTAPKRKKNKNRRRRPGNNKNVNGTKIANKPQTKEKPISTQVYNYLSREILPTVGVGLVGLMVTAGLASYFLYPFTGAVRRAYEIADRKDDKYYYNDDYNYGGLSEEDVISKVIAGMPASSAGLQDYAYAKPTATHDNRYRNSDAGTHNVYKDLQNVRYRHSNSPQYPSYSASYSQDKVAYNQISKYGGSSGENSFNYQKEYTTSPTYRPDIIAEHQKETGYTVSAVGGGEMTGQKFVVGNIPKEVMATPAAVPEHGPRHLKHTRKRRNAKQSKSIENNEIMDDLNSQNELYTTEKTSLVYPVQDSNVETDKNETDKHEDDKKPNETQEVTTNATSTNETGITFFQFLKSLFEFKMRLGMAIMQHTSEAISKYVQDVHARVEHSLRQMRLEEERNRQKQQSLILNQNSSLLNKTDIDRNDQH